MNADLNKGLLTPLTQGLLSEHSILDLNQRVEAGTLDQDTVDAILSLYEKGVTEPCVIDGGYGWRIRQCVDLSSLEDSLEDNYVYVKDGS